MDKAQILEQFRKHAANASPIGATIKFVLDDEVFLIDGTGSENRVSEEDRDADCTISTSKQTLQDLQSGKLNPMMAVMTGKVKIKGDMGLAMKLQQFLS